jgi:hypothetical protein
MQSEVSDGRAIQLMRAGTTGSMSRLPTRAQHSAMAFVAASCKDQNECTSRSYLGRSVFWSPLTSILFQTQGNIGYIPQSMYARKLDPGMVPLLHSHIMTPLDCHAPIPLMIARLFISLGSLSLSVLNLSLVLPFLASTAPRPNYSLAASNLLNIWTSSA